MKTTFRTIVVFFASVSAVFGSQGRESIPPALVPWIPWVLRDLGDSGCPILGNAQVCAATSSLELRAEGKQALFRLNGWRWSEGWVDLPGDSTLWPESVKSNGVAKAVLKKGRVPAVYLKPGPYRLEGLIRWTRRPSAIPLPSDIAFRKLEVEGRLVDAGDGNELWLSRNIDSAESVKDTAGDVRIKIFRRIDDGIPVLATTRIELSISGKERPLDLDNVLPPGSVPTGLESNLPARLSRLGNLGLTARAGNWTINIRSAWISPPKRFQMPQGSAPMPASEIWSFQSSPEIRTVRLSGAVPVDAAQAEVPLVDRSLPAWSLSRERSLEVAEILRGDPATDSVKISLDRQIWVDFDGHGVTVSDLLSGEIKRALRLSVGEPLHLGRGQFRSEGQVLTTLGGAEQGFPAKGNGNWTLLSRVEGPSWKPLPISPTGWDLERATVQVHLGLGWRLLEIAGAGKSQGTWVSGWDLWSIFLVVLAIGILTKVVSKGAAAVGAVVFVLGSQDGIQILHWLHFLVAISAWLGLKRLVPDRPATRVAALWAGLTAVVVVGVAISFTVAQVRLAMHPSLEPRSMDYGPMVEQAMVVAKEENPASPSEDREVRFGSGKQNSVSVMDKIQTSELLGEDVDPNQMNSVDVVLAGGRKGSFQSIKLPSKSPTLPEDDPAQLGGVQTGSGLPNWFHVGGSLVSEGVVSGIQTCRIVALPPMWLRIWRLIAVLGVWGLLGQIARKTVPQLADKAGFLVGQKPSMILPLLLIAAASVQAEIPTKEMLGELRQHLLQPPGCKESCAQLGEVRLAVRGNKASLDLDVQAEARGIVRLPQIDWKPTGLVVPHGAAGERDHALWAVVEPGFQTIHMEGIPLAGTLLVGFQDVPFRRRIDAVGWTREGDDPASVHLVRSTSTATAASDSSVAELVPLASLTRTLHLHREWTIETVVERASQAPGALALSVPLLPLERPVGEISVDSGHARVVLPSGVDRISWNSRLPVTDKIRLVAANNGLWSETWSLESSSRWHVLTSGTPRIGAEQNTWKPLPGEHLEISVLSPKTLEGPLHSVQNAELEVNAGRDFAQFTLTAVVVSGIGGEVFATLPPDAKLRNLQIDGAERPPQTTLDGHLRFEVSPGTHRLSVTWTGSSLGRFWVRSPEVVLSAAGANFKTTLQTSEEGWVVALGGPGEGPGILWWGMIAAMTILSWILSRIPGHPLRFVDWLLLFLGTSTVNRFGAFPLVVWAGAMLWRQRLDPARHQGLGFQLVQIGLAGLGVFAMGFLLSLVPLGLLGHPSMLVEGPFGDRTWFVDRSTGAMPQPWLFVLPFWLWKGLLLAWSLWMVRSLLVWVKWGWAAYTKDGIWVRPKPSVAADEPNPDLD